MLIRINGRLFDALPDTTVAAAILSSGQTTCRRSITGEDRAPLCGIGICFECRVTIDGLQHQRSCQIPAREGMEIVTA